MNRRVATHQKTQQGLKHLSIHRRNEDSNCRNASENPAGIETSLYTRWDTLADMVATHQKTQQGLKLQSNELR